MVTEKAKQVGYCANNKLCKAILISFSDKLAGMKVKWIEEKLTILISGELLILSQMTFLAESDSA